MSKIISIETAMPGYKHRQDDILGFMQNVYAMNEPDRRKLKFLYRFSGIENRYSVIPDYSLPAKSWKFYPPTENLEPFPSLEKRMQWFNEYAPELSKQAIEKCLEDNCGKDEITHLITVTCTGLSAPGLDLQIMELMSLPKNIFRSSVNFMGCYAAIHALKLADNICRSDKNAKVMIVCTELCTLHFQNKSSTDNIAASLLFGDGSAACLVMHDDHPADGLRMTDFYSEVSLKGKPDMAWDVTSTGFLMTLSPEIPDLIESEFSELLDNAMKHANLRRDEIEDWCIHPGGKRILTSIAKAAGLDESDMDLSSEVLKEYGNMSSPTILFVLKEIMNKRKKSAHSNGHIFGAAFGPGLSMETFILKDD